MLKASDVKGLVPDKKKADGVFRQPKCAASWNLCTDIISSKEFYLDRERLAEELNDILVEDFHLVIPPYCYEVADAIIQSFNAGQLLRVKE